MAKFFNNRVKSGKLAGSVFSVRYGDVIERAYNPYVYNPNTNAQIASRAKMKLMSQLAAVIGSYLPIMRQGAVSARNQFIKMNYQAATYVNEVADIELSRLNVTGGVLGLNTITLTRGENFNVTAQVNGNDDLSRVVFIGLAKQTDGTLRNVGSRVVSEQTSGSWGPVTFTSSLPLVVIAYGVRDNTNNARIIFGELQALSAETVAKVIVTRSLLYSDVTLTETQVATV